MPSLRPPPDLLNRRLSFTKMPRNLCVHYAVRSSGSEGVNCRRCVNRRPLDNMPIPLLEQGLPGRSVGWVFTCGIDLRHLAGSPWEGAAHRPNSAPEQPEALRRS